MRPTTILGLILLCLLPVWAQAQGEPDTAQAYSLSSITINSVRADADAPVALTNVSQQQIQQVYAGQDGAFLLSQLSPSIISYSEAGTGFSNYGQMRLRGIDQTRINLTLNGVPLNDMLDQGVFFSNFTDFGNSLQSIQVQRGVGTSTNGVASYAGSVNFESVSLGQAERSTEVQLGAGSFGTLRASGEFHSGLSKNGFAVYGRLTGFSTEGYRYHSGTDSWSGFLSGGYVGEKNRVTLTAFTGRTASGLAYFPVPLPQIERDPRTNVNFEEDVDNFGQFLVMGSYEGNPTEDLTIGSTAYYGGAGGDFPFGFDSLFGTSGPLVGQINYPLTNRRYGWIVNGAYQTGGLDLSVGLHAYRFDRRNFETDWPDASTIFYDDASRKDEFSAFAKVSYEVGPLKVFGDVQFRTLAIDFFPDLNYVPADEAVPTYAYTFVNPKVGLTYTLSSALQAYASFGRSGREPTKFDIFGGSTQLNGDNLAFVQDVNTIRPEFVNDFEAGVRFQKGALEGQVNLFWMDFQDEIAPIGERAVFVQLRKNIPNSTRRGVEIEGAWQHASGLYLQGFLTLMDAFIPEYAPDFDSVTYENVRPALTPAFMGQLALGYKKGDRLDVQLQARYVGEQFITPVNEPDLVVPASTVLDGRISWRFWKQHSLQLQAYNLLNALYYTYGEVGADENFNLVPAYFVQPPRSFMATLVWKF